MISKTLKKTLIYRGLSLLSEAAIVYLWTGELFITGGVTLSCILFHTALYYLIEKRFK